MLSRTQTARSRILAVLTLGVLGVACSDPERTVAPGDEEKGIATPRHTLSSGAASTLLARSTITEGFKVKRQTGAWEIDIHAKKPTEVTVATLTLQPGGHMGWHSHPGPGFVQVTSGTVSFYVAGDPSCTPTVVGAGHIWLDRGEAPHIARNETGAPATFLVTLFTPPGTMARIDEPAPGNGPF